MTTRGDPFPPTLVLTPTSRWPTTLPDATIGTVMNSGPSGRAEPVDTFGPATVASASIVIVTFNNLVFNKLCLESMVADTEYPNCEIIVVDNGSTDGTREYLQELVRRRPRVWTIFNADNLGFAPATNQGLARATGDILVLINNDTVVPRQWLTRLVRHLEEPAIGLVGPVTNRAGNEAEVEAPYHTYGEFQEFAREYTEAHRGESFDIRTLTMFCVAMRRDVYKRIGPLDERFQVGMFEDEDYARRVRAAGYRVVCAEDVFVHHFGQASLGKLALTGEYGELFHANRRRFEEKWGERWEPYRRRRSAEYQRLTERIRETVRTALPPDSIVIVVSRGDEELLKLDGRRAWHFPRTEDGVYAGYYPADSAKAIAHLEALRAKGGDFLLFPRTTFWWLEHYAEFKQHLERQYRVIVHQEDTCVIFALRESETDQPEAVALGNDGRAVGRWEMRPASLSGENRAILKAPAIALYLDLMKRCSTNWIYCEMEQDTFEPKVRAEGRDWPPPKIAHTMIGLKRLDNLQFCVEGILANNIPGDLIEAGVWRGGATIFMRAILKAYDVKDRYVWVADSFEGLPAPDPERYPCDAGDRLYTLKELAVTLDEVKANFGRYGLLDEQVRFLKGWFRDTLPKAPIDRLAVIRLDGDMYESTMDALVSLYPKLSVGGYLIVDDYGAIQACRQAVHDYRELYGIEDEILSIDWTGVYWRRAQ